MPCMIGYAFKCLLHIYQHLRTHARTHAYNNLILLFNNIEMTIKLLTRNHFRRSEIHQDFPQTSIVIPSPQVNITSSLVLGINLIFEMYPIIQSIISQVSKMHARVSYKDGAFYLIDLRSDHGTYIIE